MSYHRHHNEYCRREERRYDRKYSRSPSPDNVNPLPYDPIKAGTINNRDTFIHDKGILRALKANYSPSKDKKAKGDRFKTLFIGRLNKTTTEETLERVFSEYGKIDHIRIVRDIISGRSKGYAFITYKHKSDFKYAWKKANGMIIDDSKILVEFERGRNVQGWVPRRYGGGLGGKKESGQLRFGGRCKPFIQSRYSDNKPISKIKTDLSKGGVVARVEGEEPGEIRVVFMKEDKSKVTVENI